MRSERPRRVLALALALATVALAGARDVARTDAGAPPEGTGGCTRTEGPRRALAQWTLHPRRAVPSPDDLRLRWQTSPRAAASASMGSDNLAPLGEDDDDHETDGIPTTTSLTTDYDELDADYFARRTESKITDPLEQELARWYRTTDEPEAPLPESPRVEEEAKEPADTDDALPRTVGLDSGDEKRTAADAAGDAKPRKSSSRDKKNFSDEEKAGEALGWRRKEAEAARKAEEEAAGAAREEKREDAFGAVELFYADVTDPRRPVGEAVYEGRKPSGTEAKKTSGPSLDDAPEGEKAEDAFEPTAEELERDEAEYRAWVATRRAGKHGEGSTEDDVRENGDAFVDAVVADAEALRERARRALNATSAPSSARDATVVKQGARDVVARANVAARGARDAEDRGARHERAVEAFAATARDDSARRTVVGEARRANEKDGELPRGVIISLEDIRSRDGVESDTASNATASNATASNATASNATVSNATVSSDGNRRRTPALGAPRVSRSSRRSGTDRDLEANMFAAYSDLKHESEEEEKVEANAAPAAKKASPAATAKASKSSSTESSSSESSLPKKTRKPSKSSKTPREDVSRGTPPTGPLSASEEIAAEMAALVAAGKSDADAERSVPSETDPRASRGTSADADPDDDARVAAVGTVISAHDFGEDIRETSAEVLQTQRTEKRIASTRLETAVVFAVAVSVVGFGFASMREFLLRDRVRARSDARAARCSAGAEDAAGEDGGEDAISPANGRRSRRQSGDGDESVPRAKMPTKRGATASPRAREKTPLLPKQ